MRVRFPLFFTLGSLLLIGACGDGSDGPGGSSSSQMTGFLVDSAVSGVDYATPSTQGVTGPDGSFHYEEGESVRFMLGDTLLGEVVAREQVTPFDLAGAPVLTGTRNLVDAIRSEESSAFTSDITGRFREKLEIEDENHVDPFHRVINIAMLLQSFDSDGNPDNGLEILPEVVALFDGVTLDLGQRWETFRNEFELRQAMGRANSMSLFDQTHGLVRPAPALQHLYTTLGMEAAVFGLLERQRDVEGDGSVDQTERWHYDDDGNMTQATIDFIGSEEPDLLTNWEYDEAGNITRYEHGGRRGPSEIETWRFDPFGYMVRFESDGDADGTPDRVLDHDYDANHNVILEDYEVMDSIRTTETWRYDDNGTLRAYRRESDSELDGAPELIFSDEYDENGAITRQEVHHVGGLHRIAMWQYDAEGNVTSLENHDPRADPEGHYTVWRNHYDASGNVIRREEFFVAGSSEELLAVDTWQYSPDDLVTRYERDGNGDGIPESLGTWQYDAAGMVVRYEYDYGVDGKPERVDSWEYTSDGKLSRQETLTYYNSGLADDYTSPYTSAIEIWEFEYQAGGIPSAGRWSSRVDDAPLLVEESWQFDPDGKLIRYANLQDRDLHLYSAAVWNYDNAGRVTLYELDEDDDGTPESFERWQYDAVGNAVRIERDGEGEGDIGPEVQTNEYDDSGNLVRSEWAGDQNDGHREVVTYQWAVSGWGHLFALSPPAPPLEFDEYAWPE